MRFLSINNFEHYQPATKRSYPWVKLYKSLLTDREFLQLDIQSRYVYLCLFIIASECGNRIFNDASYLAHRMSMDVSQLDLKPLYRCGFLKASQSTLRRLEKREIREEERESETVPAAPVRLPRTRVSKPETEWPDGFTFNDRHKAIADGLSLNVQNEFIKFKDKALSKGWTYKDWEAGFRTWLNNAAEFQQARAK